MLASRCAERAATAKAIAVPDPCSTHRCEAVTPSRHDGECDRRSSCDRRFGWRGPGGIRMGDRSGIEWTEATWNPTTGCDRTSPGCDNCYALTLAKRLKAMGQAKYQLDG
ncbi:MAG TPA: DUF5131 family protein, partial [Acidimicrobiales bacterium]|nr:DUF5131 family protein [Acidimicrobiales bacterium]